MIASTKAIWSSDPRMIIWSPREMILVWGKASVNNWKLELETPKNSIKEMSDKEIIFSNK